MKADLLKFLVTAFFFEGKDKKLVLCKHFLLFKLVYILVLVWDEGKTFFFCGQSPGSRLVYD